MTRRTLWIVVGAAVLVALIAYWQPLAQLFESQLSAGAPGKKPASNDPRCEPGSVDVTHGPITFIWTPKLIVPVPGKSGEAATTLEEAREGLLHYALSNTQAFDCTIKYPKDYHKNQWRNPYYPATRPLVIGEMQIPEIIYPVIEDNLDVEDKKKLTCTSKKNADGTLQCAEPNMCERSGISCSNATRGVPKRKTDPASDCVGTGDPVGKVGGPFYGGTVTCTIRYKVSAVCSCSPAPKTSSTTSPSPTVTSAPTATPPTSV